MGAFYSAPADPNGVSAACYANTSYETVQTSVTCTAEVLAAGLKQLPNILNSEDSLNITLSYSGNYSDRVGYVWTITFNRQNGDLKPMDCDSALLNATNADFPPNCTITTLRNGTLVDGDFAVGLVSTGDSRNVPWNIDANSLATELASLPYNVYIDVQREPLFTNPIRWNGAYLWNITLTGTVSSFNLF